MACDRTSFPFLFLFSYGRVPTSVREEKRRRRKETGVNDKNNISF